MKIVSKTMRITNKFYKYSFIYNPLAFMTYISIFFDGFFSIKLFYDFYFRFKKN